MEFVLENTFLGHHFYASVWTILFLHFLKHITHFSLKCVELQAFELSAAQKPILVQAHLHLYQIQWNYDPEVNKRMCFR